MLLGFPMVALFMVIGRGVMGLGCVFVMFSCFAVCFVCHKRSSIFRDMAFSPIAVAIAELP